MSFQLECLKSYGGEYDTCMPTRAFEAAHKTDNLLYVTHKLISLEYPFEWKGTCLILSKNLR